VLHHAATSHDNEIEAIPPGNRGGKTIKMKPFHPETAGKMAMELKPFLPWNEAIAAFN
jgi:hypothetical protein